jgi:hypothetical protein
MVSMQQGMAAPGNAAGQQMPQMYASNAQMAQMYAQMPQVGSSPAAQAPYGAQGYQTPYGQPGPGQMSYGQDFSQATGAYGQGGYYPPGQDYNFQYR